MDIINRSYAPSLNQSSAKSLFDMHICDKKIDYILIGFVILSIVWVLYRYNKKVNTRKESNQ